MTDPKASKKAQTVEEIARETYERGVRFGSEGIIKRLATALREYGDQREAAAVEKAAKAVCTHCRDVDLWEPPILRIGYEHHKRNSGIVRACRFSGGFRAFPNLAREAKREEADREPD
jgi:hypothetical protein